MGLLSELKVIYPIERAESGEFSIKGIELPPLGELRLIFVIYLVQF